MSHSQVPSPHLGFPSYSHAFVDIWVVVSLFWGFSLVLSSAGGFQVRSHKLSFLLLVPEHVLLMFFCASVDVFWCCELI